MPSKEGSYDKWLVSCSNIRLDRRWPVWGKDASVETRDMRTLGMYEEETCQSRHVSHSRLMLDLAYIPVSEKNTSADKKTGWKFSFENLQSGAGLQFLLLGRMAKAHVKGLFGHRHR